MKTKLAFILLGISVLSGCVRGRFYPVQGPLSTQTPVPVFKAKASGPFNSGNISVVLSDGEVCKGRWNGTEAFPIPTGAGPASAPATNEMASVWDAVYGQGFYLAHIVGNKDFARGIASGNRGTVLNVEMYRVTDKRPEDTTLFKGVAKDNKGNIYKVVL
jgi:hypothetical protein